MYLLTLFIRVRSSKPLDHMEIDAWNRLTGYGISPFEVEILMMLETELQKINQND